MPTATQRLLDHMLGGQLEQYVLDRRAKGDSWRRISLEIRDQFGVDVTYQTLTNWYGSKDKVSAA